MLFKNVIRIVTSFALLNLSSAHGEDYYDTVIVGGGLAGLTTGFRFKEKGFDNFKIFEAKKRLGGRAYTHYDEKGSFVELGGERIRSDGANPNIIQLCKDLNVELEEEALPCFTIMTLDGRLLTKELASEFITECKRSYNPPQNWQGQTAEDYINNSFSTPDHHSFFKIFLAEKGFKNRQLSMNEELREGFDNAIEEMSALSFPVEQLKGQYEEIAQFRIKKGNHTLVSSLAEKIGNEHINTEHILKKVSKTKEGLYELTFMNANTLKTVLAHKVILTTPFSVLRTLELDKTLNISAATSHAINTLPYAQHNKVCAFLTDAPWEKEGYQSMLGVDIKRSGIIWSNSFGQKQHGVTFYSLTTNPFVEQGNPLFYTQPVGEEAIHSSHKDLADYKTNGYSFDKERKIMGYNWPSDPYALGSYCQRKLLDNNSPLRRTSTLDSKRMAFADPIDNSLFFAGEHTQYIEGYMDSAIASGNQTAQDILTFVRGGNGEFKSALVVESERENINIPLISCLKEKLSFTDDQFRNYLQWIITKKAPLELLEIMFQKASSTSVLHEVGRDGENLLSCTLFAKGDEPYKYKAAALLIKQGADINQQLKHGDTLLHKAISKREWALTEWLISNGANVRMLNAEKRPPLTNWGLSGNPRLKPQWDALKTLIEYSEKQDIDLWDQVHNNSLLWVALYYTQKELGVQLIHKGANVNFQDKEDKSTPLHIAAQKGWKDIMNLLIEKGARVDLKDDKGKTPSEYRDSQ